MRDDDGSGARRAGATGTGGALDSVSELSQELRVKTARARKIAQWVICKLERIRASERAALDLLSPTHPAKFACPSPSAGS